MLTRICVVLALLVLTHRALAQEQPEEDFVSERAEKKSYHYIGLQANQLIRQILSFGGNSSPVTNPYLLTYSVNAKKNGLGLATGLGYSSIQTKTNDVFNNTISKVDDISFRIGMEKKSYLSKRWMVGFGGDILIENNKAETTTTPSGSSSFSVTTKINRYGFGPRASLNYHFHDKILIGTETSFYLKWITQDQESTGQGAPTNPPSTKLRSFAFTLPAVLFVTLKL